MATTSQKILILLNLLTLACCITTADQKEEVKVENIDAEENQDDLEAQETGWIFNPLQEKSRTFDYLKDKVLYPFSALKSPGASFGGFPIYTSGASHSYNPWSYPSYSFAGSGSYLPPPKPKQFYNYSPGWSYKKPNPAYSYKTLYNKNYYSTGGYQVNMATYAPDCYHPAGPAFPTSTASPPTYSSGTPLYYYYSSVTPSQSYGVPGINFVAKAATTPSPISSHSQPTGFQGPSSTYSFRVSSEPQYVDNSAQIISSSENPANPPSLFSSSLTGISSSTYSPTIPSGPTTPPPLFSTTPLPSVVSTTPTPTTISQSSWPSGPSSFPIPNTYSQGDEGTLQEIVITPPTQNAKGNYVTAPPGPKLALPESSYLYNQPQYAVAYYPNVFYITNEQRLEKTSSSQSVGGTQDVPSDGSVDDSSDTSTPSSDSQKADVSAPVTKSQQPVETLPGPGLTTFYSSQTLDQTRFPISSGQFLAPQTPGGFYSSAVGPGGYAGASGPYSPLLQAAPAVPLTLPLPLSYTYGQNPVGYQITRTSKNC